MYTSNVVANQLTIDLKEKLVGGGYCNSDLTLWISSEGNDTNADGTKEKPFKTFRGCLNYLYSLNQGKDQIAIDFLTDYTDSDLEGLYYISGIQSVSPSFGVNRRLIIQNSLKKSVILPAISVTNAQLTIRDVTLERNSNGSVLISNNALVVLAGETTFNYTYQEASNVNLLSCTNRGFIIVTEKCILNLNNKTSNAISSAFYLNKEGLLAHIFTSATMFTVNLTGAFNYVFDIDFYSAVLCMSRGVFNAEGATVAHKLRAYRKSYFESNNRGLDFLPGDDAQVSSNSEVA